MIINQEIFHSKIFHVNVTQQFNSTNLPFTNQHIQLSCVGRKALRMAREVADETGTLMGGNICNTGIYDPDNPESIEKAKLVNKVC